MKRLIPLTILGLIAALPSAALAASYLEFHPDYVSSLNTAVTETPSEVFLPLNEYLSGFDLWLSNGSNSGPATFTLFNSSNQQLAATSVTLPALADTEEGTRYHVNLPYQLAVTGNKAYRIEISSPIPQLRLYYAPQVRILPLNGVPPPVYTNGLARLGSDDQSYSFAFALYESRESSPPILSNVGTSQNYINSVELIFNANEPVDYSLTYGNSTTPWAGNYSSCVSGIRFCSLSLPVTPGTTYQYTLIARDMWGNQATQTGVFASMDYGQTPTPTPTIQPTTTATPTQTATPTTTAAPAPLRLTNPRVLNIKDKSADFAWTTNNAANSLAIAQMAPLMIAGGGNSDATLELEHYITVPNLIPDTYYQATLTSYDSFGGYATATIMFMTTRTPPAPTATPQSSAPPASPAATNIAAQPSPTISSDPGSQKITWPAQANNEPSDGYRVDIFDANNNLVRTVTVPAGVHETNVSLAEGQRAVVYANNDGTYKKVAAPIYSSPRKKKISGLETAVMMLPYILGAAVLGITVAVVTLKLRKKKTPSGTVTNPGIAP